MQREEFIAAMLVVLEEARRSAPSEPTAVRSSKASTRGGGAMQTNGELEALLQAAVHQAAADMLPFRPSNLEPDELEDYLTELFQIADRNGDGVL